MPKSKTNFVYILECSDKTLYTGYTVDIKKRIENHNSEKNGAKYTRVRQPVKLIYVEKFETKSEALKREHEIKKLSRSKKLELIKQNPNQLT